MRMIPMTSVQYLLDQAAMTLPAAKEASAWRYRHGVAQVCAGLLVLLLGPWGVQQVADCEAPHATVLRSGWMFQVFPFSGQFTLVCTRVESPDREPAAFLLSPGIINDRDSALRVLSQLDGAGISVGVSGWWS